MKEINPQIILLHSSNNVEILLVMFLSLLPPNFCMTQSQYFVIKFSSFLFLPPEVSDSKTTRGVIRPPQHFYQGGIKAFVSQLFHDAKSIFIKFSSFIFSTT